MKFSIIFTITIFAMIGMISPSVLAVYAYDGPTIDLDKIMENRVLQIDQKCIGTSEIKFYEKCDTLCNDNIINYNLKNNANEIISSGSFENFLTIPIKEFPEGETIEFFKKGFQDNELKLCSLTSKVVDHTITAANPESYNYQESKSASNSNENKIYTYAEIYAITDQAGLDCDMKYGSPPFNSMNQQFEYNECHNNVNTWELDQLDRTDYYGEPQRENSGGGGCLIATATYGSELAPQVQQLRELRDNQLLNTESGTAFMSTFNDIYYSFSPIIADYERENPYFKEAVKLAITPMISSLSLMDNAETESEVLSIGISVIALNIGMYLGVPAIVVIGIKKIR